MWISFKMTVRTKRNQVNGLVSSSPIALKFSEWADMVNIQLSANLFFRDLAISTSVIIAMAYLTTLLAPIWAVIGIISAQPMTGVFAGQSFQIFILAFIRAVRSRIFIFEPGARSDEFDFTNRASSLDTAVWVVLWMIYSLPVLIAAIWGTEFNAVTAFYIGIFPTAVLANTYLAFGGVDYCQSRIPAFVRAIVVRIMPFCGRVDIKGFSTSFALLKFTPSNLYHNIKYITQYREWRLHYA